MQRKPFITSGLECYIWRQFCAKFGSKKAIFEKTAIDNQQVTYGGRVYLNPASATINPKLLEIQQFRISLFL